MNDDDVSTRAEAASAYLDGELDAPERALVAADPETMALVDTFTQLRHSLGEVPPVADDVRAAALSAALAEFDAVRNVAAVAPAPAARVTALQPRWQRASRVLRGVAAAAVIAVIAVAALNARGSDSKSSSSATAPPLNVASAPRVETAPASTRAAAAGAAPAATAAAAGTAAPTGAASTKMSAADLPAIDSPDALAQYAANFAADAASSTPRPSAAPAVTELVPVPALPPSSCLASTDTVLGPISVLGVPAWAVRNDSTGVVRAIAADDCRLLLSTAN